MTVPPPVPYRKRLRQSEVKLARAADKPPANPLHRLAHLRRSASVAEADKVLTFACVEVDARRGGDVGLGEHALGELEGIVREARHVGVKIESAIGGQKRI